MQGVGYFVTFGQSLDHVIEDETAQTASSCKIASDGFQLGSFLVSEERRLSGIAQQVADVANQLVATIFSPILIEGRNDFVRDLVRFERRLVGSLRELPPGGLHT